MTSLERIEEGSKVWWAEKYKESQDYLYGKEPSPFLVENFDLVRKGRVLDVAMGEGRNATYLASKDCQVLGIDFNETAVERAGSLAKNSGVEIETKLLDLNFYVVPLMEFDTMILTDFHPPITLLKGLTRGLKPGGTLLVEGYTLEQLRLSSGPKPEAFECYKSNELINNVRDLHIMLYNERQISEKSFRVQLIAKKPSR